MIHMVNGKIVIHYNKCGGEKNVWQKKWWSKGGKYGQQWENPGCCHSDTAPGECRGQEA